MNTEDIDDMCSKVNLVSYVTQTYERPIRKGGKLFVHCPIHNGDDNASLCLYPESNSWYCFGCHEGGSILSWMLKAEGMRYKDALGKLQRMTGVEINPNLKESSALEFYRSLKRLMPRTGTKRERVYQLYSDYAKLPVCRPDEWRREGITDEAMERFDIREDRRSHRVVYPLYDKDGRYICPKGRTMFWNDYKKLDVPKYFSLGKPGYQDFFCGMKENKEDIINAKSVIVFEAIKSVMKAWGWGYSNCVAAETSALTDEQIKILVGMPEVSDVIIAFDKDKKLPDIQKNLMMLSKFKNTYVIIDHDGLLGDKDSPADCGKETFERLLSRKEKLF